MSAFSANAHPDWEKWDLLEKACNSDGVDITMMSVEMLWDLVSARPVASMFSMQLIEAMLERYAEWKANKAKRQPFQAEAAVLASLRRMEELWSNYCLCYFRCTTMLVYRQELARLPECVLEVRWNVCT